MQTYTKIPPFKSNLLLIAILGTMLLISMRLFQLQIQQSETFYKKSQKNFLRIEKIEPTRGNILDIHGNMIATNRPIHNLYWKGTGNRLFTDDKLKILQSIEKIIDKRLTTNEKLIMQIKQAERCHKKVLIASDIPFTFLSKLEEQFSHENSISISTDFTRYYPYHSLACHILGYLGRINVQLGGKMGLEKILDQTLKGKSGSILKTINSLGKQLSQTPLQQALSGIDIKTTVDLNLQKMLENIFPENEIGTAILMDPGSGGILAMVSRPTFDPNIFLSPITKKDWKNLQANNPFLNRAFSACYPPGSIFKLITMSAALENNIIDPEKPWECKGYVRFGGRNYLCHKLNGHGTLTASQALEQSCNTYFYEIAKKIDIDLLADYAQRFGLGQKTNALFPEQQGLVPDKKWKLEHKGERWYKGETLSASIGQSFLSTTPIQIARMISSIFTGYLVTPRILDQEPIVIHPLEIAPDTLAFLRQSMKKVVTQGTGKNISRIKDFEIYAKTSTAQTSALHKRRLGNIYREHRWFVLYFTYKNNKPITLVILIEHSESAAAAKNTAKKFLIEYKRFVDAYCQE